MTSQWQYKIRDPAYWLKCLNPFTNTITISHLPLGLRLHAYKRDGVGRGLYRRKLHEPGLTNLLLERYSGTSPRNFIDVGANIGYFSCLLSKLAGTDGTVLAVEPERQNLELLERNVLMNALRNVDISRCAAGATTETALLGLYKPANRGRHSMVDPVVKSAIEVPVRTLDDLTAAAEHESKSWSLVKIDVEGYESFVLEGAKKTLSRTETLVVEYSPQFLRKAGVDPASIFDALSGNFSKISRIDGMDLVTMSVSDCLGCTNQIDLVFDR